MKVGTDGVLIGSWANHVLPKDILDIGTGTGLIALMLAQRFPNANIVGVDVDQSACKDAQHNFNQSPFFTRMQLVKGRIQNYNPPNKFDLVVSNPPFFENSLKPSTQSRSTARHTGQLNFRELINNACRLLNKNGVIAMIIPKSREFDLISITEQEGLFLEAITEVRGTSFTPVKRVLVAFSRKPGELTKSTLVVENSRHQYTNEYIQLTKDFYLKM